MKKLYTILLIFGLTGLGSTLHAQNAQGDFAAGVGITYGFDIFDGDFGINVNANYSFTDELRGAFDFTYWLADEDGLEDVTAWDMNFNAHYLFVNDANLRVYALAGIHYASFSWDIDEPGFSMSISDSEVGFNIGAGLEYDFGGAMFFAEPKFSINGWDQLAVTAGIRFGF